MAAPVVEILNFLDTKDATLRSMIRSFADCTTRARADQLIKEIRSKEKEYAPDFRAAGKRPFCSIFFSAAYFASGRHSQALKHLDDAERGFNCSGQELNLALARWMHALVDQEMGHLEPARLDFENAEAILKRLTQEDRRNGRYEAAEECGTLIERIKGSIRTEAAPAVPTPAQSRENAPQKPKVPPAIATKPLKRSDSLVFPVYDSVSAGKGGDFIFDSQPQGQVSIRELAIDEKPFRVYSLRAGEPVILRPRVYRWMYVVGDSMNQARPHPLVEGDCLLVVETSPAGLSPQPDDIVVAALAEPTSSADRAGVVKRYTPAGLCSESSQAYPLIPLKKARVRGIVLAVAKPV